MKAQKAIITADSFNWNNLGIYLTLFDIQITASLCSWQQPSATC